ncbi:MAG TPA: acyltransferase family protein [Streptosporangiaceae bacterium]|nr:acyltransferase family protein [Streptosporangiaceae bacterium]
MPEPVRSGQRYMPGLDGLRALAVLAVIAFHEQLGWAPGGLLGVGVFFTLSGYLITDLLLGQWSAHGRLNLGDFWLRRARRLLPALFVMLAVVTAWVTVVSPSRLASLRGAVAAAATYSSNWYYIAAHSSYFSRFAPPAPFDHLWSLAVEEQFYLVWPWLLLLGVCCLRGRRASAVRWLALPTLALAAASAAAMLVLYHPGLDPTRVYEGSDTRACGLLIGAALAMVWPSRRQAGPARWTRLVLDGAGVAGLAVIGLMIWRVGQYSPFIYRGGLVVLSVATAGVVAAAACPGSLVGLALGWQPLRWIGVRSYGIYLWHFPVIVLTSPANSAENLPRAALQVAASIGLAALSWRFVEEPVRHGALGRIWQRVRVRSAWREQPAGLRGWAGVTGGAMVVALACAGLSGAVPAPGAGVAAAGALTAGSVLPQPPRSKASGAAQAPSPTSSGQPTPGAAAAGTPLRTSCRAVAHIGDSTSEGMISPDYLPNPAQRIPAQYGDVGVSSVRTDISGARSVVETLPGQVNGYDAARAIYESGFRGCWVIALGTNDTADVAVGSQVGLMTRIERMMAAARGEPVMWVNLRSLLASGPYAESNMLIWDNTLLHACARYPNMRIYDWASVAKARWYISDGIHFTSAGYAVRSRLIAQALAEAFPSTGHSSGCVVG